MQYQFLHSILRGRWLVEPSYAQSVLPMLPGLLKGNINGAEINQGFNNQERMISRGASQESSEIQIALYQISGAVTKYDGPCGEPGMMTHAKQLKSISQQNDIDAIVLLIDSPGGEAYGTSLLAEAIKNIQKPIFSIIDDGMAASAAYWIASATDGIYTTKSTDLIGSVGTLITLIDPTGAWEKEGFKVKTVYAPQSTEKNKSYRNFIEKGDTSEIESELKTLAAAFIDAVKENRGEKLSDETWSSGRLFYAPQALESGLIDGIMPFDQIIETIAQKITKPKNNSEMSNKNENKYPAIAKAIGWSEGHESTDEGIFINHDEASALEATFTTASAQLQQMKDSKAASEEKSNGLSTELAQLKTVSENMQQELNNLKSTNSILKEKADKYDQLAANKGTNLPPQGEHEPGAEDHEESVHSVTAEAMALFQNAKQN